MMTFTIQGRKTRCYVVFQVFHVVMQAVFVWSLFVRSWLASALLACAGAGRKAVSPPPQESTGRGESTVQLRVSPYVKNMEYGYAVSCNACKPGGPLWVHDVTWTFAFRSSLSTLPNLGFAHGMVVTTKGSRLEASLLQVKRGQDVASVCGRFAVDHPYHFILKIKESSKPISLLITVRYW